MSYCAQSHTDEEWRGCSKEEEDEEENTEADSLHTETLSR
jgi:hypothetical protein